MQAWAVVTFVKWGFGATPNVFANTAIKLVLGANALRHGFTSFQRSPVRRPIRRTISTARIAPPVSEAGPIMP